MFFYWHLKQKINPSILLFVSLFTSWVNFCQAEPTPLLRFTDIVYAPNHGLQDGRGEGAIITLWGQHLGERQEKSRLVIVDKHGKQHQPAYVYYWKNADGLMPSGPADLYQSHKMQEIAFSIPSSIPIGPSKIKVYTRWGQSNELTINIIREGAILWVSPGGHNHYPCTFRRPCKYINADIGSGRKGGVANKKLSPGTIIYSRGVIEPDLCGGGRCSALFVRNIRGTKQAPISFIAYPNSRPLVKSKNSGFIPYQSKFINISKFSISVGHQDPQLAPNAGSPAHSDIHMRASRGRYVGNLLMQNPGTCITGWAGSITSNEHQGEGVKFYGNEVAGLGCRNTSRFQHTTYMSIRNASSRLKQAWDFSYNFLHDNYAMFGIHFYDEQIYKGDCGQLHGTLRVSNNVISKQWGTAINIASKDTVGERNICWEADIIIENNLLIDTGLGDSLEDKVIPPPNAIRVTGDIGSKQIRINNNSLINWGNEKSLASTQNTNGIIVDLNRGHQAKISLVNNLLVNKYNSGFYSLHQKNAHIGQNLLFSSERAIVKKANINGLKSMAKSLLNNNDQYGPAELQGYIWENPQIFVFGVSLNIPRTSPIVDRGRSLSGLEPYDIYGNYREKWDIGAIEFIAE